MIEFFLLCDLTLGIINFCSPVSAPLATFQINHFIENRGIIVGYPELNQDHQVQPLLPEIIQNTKSPQHSRIVKAFPAKPQTKLGHKKKWYVSCKDKRHLKS